MKLRQVNLGCQGWGLGPTPANAAFPVEAQEPAGRLTEQGIFPSAQSGSFHMPGYQSMESKSNGVS